ncbi:hypothetical protein D9619_008591 [Psilocybe cf. subviscida]|uniref:DUF6534 domain-containing protein n=1 Tax=Psilocybe cf. subviscida TaxID=2480587 RepID=A0A8H5BA98_9AGAR|nr:hypothetical protein D9619_008591 [Psilocybe cf. subviscida]
MSLPNAFAAAAANTTTPAVLPGVVSKAGPIYLGILLNWALYGILVVQVYIYYSAFKRDQWSARILVAVLFFLDSLQSILLAHDGFATFAAGFGNTHALNSILIVWISVPLISAIVSTLVQNFFAYRIYILSGKNIWIPALIICTSWMQGISSLLAAVKAEQVQLYSLLEAHAHLEIVIWHAGSAGCDVIIACAMCYYLWKRDTGMNKTHALIIRLITLTIETGTATATVALISLILFFALPSQIYFITPSFLAAKLYANTVVLIFNNRAQISQARNHVSHSTFSMDGVQIRQDTGMSGVAHSQLHFGTNSFNDGVQVSKSVSVWEDNKNADLELSTMNGPHAV